MRSTFSSKALLKIQAAKKFNQRTGPTERTDELKDQMSRKNEKERLESIPSTERDNRKTETHLCSAELEKAEKKHKF